MGTTLFGNYGLKAIKIPSGKTVFRIQKRIKSSNYLSPFNGTIGSFPEMSIKEAELEALEYVLYVIEEFILENMKEKKEIRNYLP